MGKKLKGILKYFSPYELKRELKSLGQDFTISNMLVVTGLVIFIGFVAGYLMKLEWYCIMLLGLVLILSIPPMLISRFKLDYERRRFDDTVTYMEQLIHSFRKNGKIRDSLCDVLIISEGNIKRIVQEMLDILDFDSTNENLFRKAFDVMENEYKCYRMRILHEFIFEIETNGGDADRALGVLLDDIRAWSERTLVYQRTRKKSRNDVTLSLCLAMFSCGLMINMMPAEYVNQITPSPIYQAGTTIVLTMCILLYDIASFMIGGSYLDIEVDGESSDAAVAAMNYVVNYNSKSIVKPAIVNAAIFIGMTIVLIFYKLWYLVPAVVAFGVYVTFRKPIKKNQCVKNILREVNKMFPTWMRNLVLYLQTDNVHVAIRRSYDSCPRILKPELKNFINGIDKDPTSMKPYLNFLKDFDVPTLKLSVNYLYSMATMGSEDGIAQLDYLIEQNNKLSIAEESIRNEQNLGGFSLMVYMPMLLAIIKLSIDMVLLLMMFMGLMGNAMDGIQL